MAEHDASNPYLRELTAMLKEIMDKSPNRHLPEHQDRIVSALSEKAFPFLSFLMKADEDQAMRMIALLKFWFEEAYDDLLKNYPDGTVAKPDASSRLSSAGEGDKSTAPDLHGGEPNPGTSRQS